METHRPARAHVERFLERYAAVRDGHTRLPIASHFADLDEVLNGFHPGELTVLAARPGAGATALALQMVRQQALHGGHRVAYTTARIPAATSVRTLACSLANLRANLVTHGFLRSADQRRLVDACDLLASANLYLANDPVTELDALAREWRQMRDAHAIEMFCYDGAAYLRPGAPGEVIRRLRDLAQELSVPVLALLPLQPEAEDRATLTLADLWGGDEVAGEADTILLLRRIEHGNPERDRLDVRIAKHVGGNTGSVRLRFNRLTLRVEACWPELPR